MRKLLWNAAQGDHRWCGRSSASAWGDRSEDDAACHRCADQCHGAEWPRCALCDRADAIWRAGCFCGHRWREKTPALLAVQILATADDSLRDKLAHYKEDMKESVQKKEREDPGNPRSE